MMDPIVELALRWLLTDVAVTGAPKPRIELAENPKRGEEASLWLHGDVGWGIVEHPHLPDHEQIAHIAEEFQGWVIEENWERNSNWPPCRLHPSTHPMQVDAEPETIHWTCPMTGEELATLGNLYGGSWYANAPDGGEHGRHHWLKIMPEWGLTIPLWDDDGPAENKRDARALLGVSPRVLDRLSSLQQTWDALVADVADDRHDGEETAEDVPWRAIDENTLRAELDLRDLGLAVMDDLAKDIGPDWRIQLRL